MILFEVVRHYILLKRKMATTSSPPWVIFTTSTYGNENDALKALESLYLISQDRARTLTWSITLMLFLFFQLLTFLTLILLY